MTAIEKERQIDAVTPIRGSGCIVVLPVANQFGAAAAPASVCRHLADDLTVERGLVDATYPSDPERQKMSVSTRSHLVV
jgi:hypothetical protein